MSTNLNELNVLVVEDDDFQRQMLVKMLGSLGVASVNSTSNGKLALDILHAENGEPTDIVVCDLNMPEMDGLEFLRHLGQGGNQVSVIITSALGSKLLESAGKMSRMYGIKLLGVVEKPIMPAQFQELFSRHEVTEKKWQQPAAEKIFTLEEILQGIREKQFEPFFQPKANLKSGRLTGAEALARWHHPLHGVIGPYSFISQLEQSGNIDELTFIMLEKAAAACRRCHDKGHPLSVSVNLSLVSLDNPELADKITRMVRNNGIDTQYIVLEITESAVMTNAAQALENLARLCMHGFSLSIDDYGTGYSSMQQLTRIPFSELKIDQSFVKDFVDNQALRVVVESSIDMAHKLRIKSVAEGVETQQHWDMLSGVGCDTAQGYFLAKPMDESAFHDFIIRYNHKSAEISPPHQPDQRDINILIVDDDSFTRKMVRRVLIDIGFVNITEADCADSAINLLNANNFDLIITDVDMPGKNGLQFAQLIRMGKTPVKSEIRIILLTSFSNTAVLSAALALDVNGFLVKPITQAAMDEKIYQAMSERLHLHAPLAYESIKTTLVNGVNHTSASSKTHQGAAITLGHHEAQEIIQDQNQYHLPLRRLRPGMILEEQIHLPDGTLLLSSGHTFSELSINRLNDLATLLPKKVFAVQDIS